MTAWTMCNVCEFTRHLGEVAMTTRRWKEARCHLRRMPWRRGSSVLGAGAHGSDACYASPLRHLRAGSREKVSTGWSDRCLWTASVQPVLHTGWSNKIKQQRRCSCPEESQNWNSTHRLNWHDQNQNTGAVVQRDCKTDRTEHRLNRRRQISIGRLNGQSSSRKALTGWTDALGSGCTGATRWQAENPNVGKTYTPVDPTHTISKHRFIRG